MSRGFVRIFSSIISCVLTTCLLSCGGSDLTPGETSSADNALGSATSCGSSNSYTVTNLLEDPSMLNGVNYGWGTVNDSLWHPNAATNCKDRYKNKYQSKGITGTIWEFIEVCEDTCFCDNPVNPVIYSNRIDYGNNHKRFSIDKTTGIITMSIDTNREWRNGCALNGLEDGITPHYVNENSAWNWNHFLVSHTLDLGINDYDKLEFSGDFRILESAKTSGDCGNDKNFENPHNLIYLAIALQHIDNPSAAGAELTSEPEIFYSLIPLWSTSDGAYWYDFFPLAGTDPTASNYVYIARSDDVLGNYKLKKTMTNYQRYTVDLRRLAREALYARGQMTGNWVDENHYKIISVYFGAEIWGGFGFTMAVKNLSIKGYNYISHTCVDWFRYWNASVTDHYYTTDYLPGGFLGYALEGRMSGTPAYQLRGTVPLYRYFNSANADHYYSIGLWPFGAGCSSSPICGRGAYVYEGAKAYVWTTPGNGRIPVYEFFNAKTGDHLYSTNPTDGQASVPFAGGYYCSPSSCNTPVFYMAW
jgi:hypothetical protein